MKNGIFIHRKLVTDTPDRMEILTFTPASFKMLLIAVRDNWPHKIIGQLAIDAEEAGIPIEVINEILQTIRKAK